MPVSYSIPLLALSVLIAVSTTFVGTELGHRAVAARSRLRFWWLSGGASCVGVLNALADACEAAESAAVAPADLSSAIAGVGEMQREFAAAREWIEAIGAR